MAKSTAWRNSRTTTGESSPNLKIRESQAPLGEARRRRLCRAVTRLVTINTKAATSV
jgi:hypothetical protein